MVRQAHQQTSKKLTPKQQYKAAWHQERHFRHTHDVRAYQIAYNAFSSFAYHSLRNREHPLMAFETRRIHTDGIHWTPDEVRDDCYSFYGICGVLHLDAEVYQEA
jgi:hypothetical protein